MIETALTAAALAVGLVLLWTKRQRYEFNSFQATLLSILEIVSVFVSIVALGWLGVVIKRRESGRNLGLDEEAESLCSDPPLATRRTDPGLG